MDPEGCLAEPAIDSVCVGEGEEALLELVREGRPAGASGTWATGRTAASSSSRSRPYADITRLPPKDYEIFDFQAHDRREGRMGRPARLEGLPLPVHLLPEPQDHQALQGVGASRPKSYIRRHSVDQVIGEIEHLLSRYERIKMFIFDDDLFTFDKEWLREFSEKYQERDAHGFVCNAHVRMFDEEAAAYLKEAGCRIVKFGVESGSERIRRDVLCRYMTNAGHRERLQGGPQIRPSHVGLRYDRFTGRGDGRRAARPSGSSRRCSRAASGGRSSSPSSARGPTRSRKSRARSTSRGWRASTTSRTRRAWTWARRSTSSCSKVKDFFCAFVNGYAGIPEYDRHRLRDRGVQTTQAWQADEGGHRRERSTRPDERMADAGRPPLRGEVQPLHGCEE